MSLFYSAYLYYAVVKECKAIQLFSSRVDSDSVKSSGILMDKYANSDPSSCQRSTSWGFYINWIRPFYPTAIWSGPLKLLKIDPVVKLWIWIFSQVLHVMIKSLIEICEAELLLFDKRQKQNSGRKSWIDFKSEIQGQFLSFLIFGISSICKAQSVKLSFVDI